MSIEIVEKLGVRLREMAARLHEIDRRVVAEGAARPQLIPTLMRERASLAPSVELHAEIERCRREAAEAEAAARTESDPDMVAEFRKEVAVLQSKVDALAARLVGRFLDSDPDDLRDVILEIRAGVGGDEAALFVAELRRMYMRFAERLGFSVEVLSAYPTPLGGLTETALLISGEGAYAQFRYESGGHRVQRVPATEAAGRIHTSTATVAVLRQVDDIAIDIKDSDLVIDTYRASGAGGQHVNKTDSAVRVTHIPSGIVVACQDERSQQKNRARAMSILKARLHEHATATRDAERAKDRREQVGSGDRSDKIRTYNFPQDRITDHRIGVTMHGIPAFLDGALDGMVGKLRDEERTRRLKAILEEKRA